MKKFSVVAAATTAILCLSACGSSSDDGAAAVAEDCTPAHPDVKTLKKGELTVASYDVPPFLKVEGDKLAGVDGEILTEIAKMECLTLVPKAMDSSAVIPSVQSKRADVAAGDWYRTADRAKVVSLSDPVYLDQMALLSKDGVSDISELKGRTVGSVSGSLWQEDMKAILGSDLKAYASFANLYQDLKLGRVDVGIDGVGSGRVGAPEGFEVVPVEPNEGVKASQNAGQSNFPTKDNPSLLEAINDNLATLRENGKLVEILEKNGFDASAAEVGEPREL